MIYVNISFLHVLLTFGTASLIPLLMLARLMHFKALLSTDVKNVQIKIKNVKKRKKT